MKTHITKHIKPVFVGVVILAVSNAVLAVEEPSDSNWSGNLTLGLQGFRGNAVMNFINASLEVTYNKDFNADNAYRHTIAGSYSFADYEIPTIDGFEFGTIDMIDNRSASYQMDYFLNDRSYASAMAMHYHDKPAGMEHYNVLGLEYTRFLSKTEGHQFSATVGFAPYVDTEYTDGQTFDGIGGKLGLGFSGQLTDTVSLSQTAELLATEDLTFTTADTALNVQITETITLQLSHNYKNFSKVPAGFKKSDSITGLNVVLNF